MSTPTLDLNTILAGLAAAVVAKAQTPASAPPAGPPAVLNWQAILGLFLPFLVTLLKDALAPKPAKPVLQPGAQPQPNPNNPGNSAPQTAFDLDDVIPPGPAKKVASSEAKLYQGQLNSERFGSQGSKVFEIKQGQAIPWDSKVWGTLTGRDDSAKEFLYDRLVAAGLLFRGEWEFQMEGSEEVARIIGPGWDGHTLYTAQNIPPGYTTLIGKPKPIDSPTQIMTESAAMGFGFLAYLWGGGMNFQGKVREEGVMRVRGRLSSDLPWSAWTGYTVS